MITKSKLSNRPGGKLKGDFSGSKKKKSKKILLLLLILLLVVGGVTFGIIWVVYPMLSPQKVEDKEASSNNQSERNDNAPEDPAASSEETESIQPITDISSNNPTIKYGRLMLINPNFTVEQDFIAARKLELISLSGTYGINELHSYNGDNLIDKEAAEWLNRMLADYTVANPGHSMQTISCFREIGTSCGRLCMPTGASDHHTGLTCDLIDPTYGTSLDTSTYDQHTEWQWLKANSYKYGFIDRFPEAWAGGSMDEPMNIDAEGSTGLFETWHYRYVGIYAATEIATGVYNNGAYDSLEHYLKMRGLVPNLLNN